MTDPPEPRGLRRVRALARLLLLLYPRDVRREMDGWYLRAAEHRWGKERRRGRGATVRTAALLVADAVRAAPRLRRRERAVTRGRVAVESRSGLEARASDRVVGPPPSRWFAGLWREGRRAESASRPPRRCSSVGAGEPGPWRRWRSSCRAPRSGRTETVRSW